MTLNNNPSRFHLTFEWHSLLRDLLRNLWLVVLAALIMHMGIYVAERSVCSPDYTSSATLAVRARTGTSGTYANLSVSSDMAGIFATVFKDSSMQKMAAQNMGMETFESTVSTSVTEGINLMTLSVTSRDPELAYHLLQSILEVHPNISGAVFSNAVIDVVTAPHMPTSPSNSISNLYRGLFMLAAMVIMAAIIIVLSLLRDTVKHESAFHASIDAKLLGTVVHEKPHLSRKERLLRRNRPLLIDDAYSSLKFTEDYRKLTTRLEYIQKHDGSKTFAVTSVTGHEGKSTAASNLALALAGRGYRVMLMDSDVRKPSICSMFGYHSDSESDDALSRKAPEREYKFLRYQKSSLFLALHRTDRPDAPQWLSGEPAAESIPFLRNKMDFILIDTPPAAASADAASIITFCDKTLLVVRTDTAHIKDINDTIMTISKIGGKLAGCILNDVHRPFTFFGQIGQDGSGGRLNRYGSYSRQGNDCGQALSGYAFEPDR